VNLLNFLSILGNVLGIWPIIGDAASEKGGLRILSINILGNILKICFISYRQISIVSLDLEGLHVFPREVRFKGSGEVAIENGVVVIKPNTLGSLEIRLPVFCKPKEIAFTTADGRKIKFKANYGNC